MTTNTLEPELYYSGSKVLVVTKKEYPPASTHSLFHSTNDAMAKIESPTFLGSPVGLGYGSRT
jgi:hypothetical protein